jgi:hypothetical protein
MIFGHNTNVAAGASTYHVQTEDRGTASALIDTTVYCGGRVLHRLTNHYLDLLPLDPQREAALKIRLDEQHRQVLEEIRSGALWLAPPGGVAASAGDAAASTESAIRGPLALELRNAKAWLTGRRAALHIVVRDASGNAVPGAQVTARVDGAAAPVQFAAESGAHGEAQLEFEMPKITGADGTLVLEAAAGAAVGGLRFQLRVRPRVPAV